MSEEIRHAPMDAAELQRIARDMGWRRQDIADCALVTEAQAQRWLDGTKPVSVRAALLIRVAAAEVSA
jgi:hypothetical protein